MKILSEIEDSARKGERKYFRIFNVRTGADCFTLHKGTSKYLFRDPKYIECLNATQAIETLYRLNKKLQNSNYLDFQIIYEENSTM